MEKKDLSSRIQFLLKKKKIIKPDIIYCASFDIGKKNFSFYIESFSVSELEKIKNIPKINRYNADGTATNEMKEILQKVYLNGETVLHCNLDLTKNCNKAEILDSETYHNMVSALDDYKEQLDLCSFIIIERQMSFGKKMNLMAVKLAQHCYSYFVMRYGREKTVIEFDAFHKTQVLGAPKIGGKTCKNGKVKYKAMSQIQRKKWAVTRALEILEERNDVEAISNIQKAKKKDDFCDSFLQLQAAKYLIWTEKCY